MKWTVLTNSKRWDKKADCPMRNKQFFQDEGEAYDAFNLGLLGDQSPTMRPFSFLADMEDYNNQRGKRASKKFNF